MLDEADARGRGEDRLICLAGDHLEVGAADTSAESDPLGEHGRGDAVASKALEDVDVREEEEGRAANEVMASLHRGDADGLILNLGEEHVLGTLLIDGQGDGRLPCIPTFLTKDVEEMGDVFRVGGGGEGDSDVHVHLWHFRCVNSAVGFEPLGSLMSYTDGLRWELQISDLASSRAESELWRVNN